MALIAGLVEAIGSALGVSILVPAEPRLSAAFGAACLAADDARETGVTDPYSFFSLRKQRGVFG